ncbi:unnamed protein product [Orchesella dallaii]
MKILEVLDRIFCEHAGKSRFSSTISPAINNVIEQLDWLSQITFIESVYLTLQAAITTLQSLQDSINGAYGDSSLLSNYDEYGAAQQAQQAQSQSTNTASNTLGSGTRTLSRSQRINVIVQNLNEKSMRGNVNARADSIKEFMAKIGGMMKQQDFQKANTEDVVTLEIEVEENAQGQQVIEVVEVHQQQHQHQQAQQFQPVIEVVEVNQQHQHQLSQQFEPVIEVVEVHQQHQHLHQQSQQFQPVVEVVEVHQPHQQIQAHQVHQHQAHQLTSGGQPHKTLAFEVDFDLEDETMDVQFAEVKPAPAVVQTVPSKFTRPSKTISLNSNFRNTRAAGYKNYKDYTCAYLPTVYCSEDKYDELLYNLIEIMIVAAELMWQAELASFDAIDSFDCDDEFGEEQIIWASYVAGGIDEALYLLAIQINNAIDIYEILELEGGDDTSYRAKASSSPSSNPNAMRVMSVPQSSFMALMSTMSSPQIQVSPSQAYQPLGYVPQPILTYPLQQQYSQYRVGREVPSPSYASSPAIVLVG